MGCREPQFGSLQTEDMYRGRGYPRKTLVAAGPESGACTVACVCLHAGTYKVLAQVQNTYVYKVHATPDLLTRHDLHTHSYWNEVREACDLCVMECRRTNQLMGSGTRWQLQAT